MAEDYRTPVLIVGAGPIGLTMAIDLAYNGVECILVERTDGAVTHPKIGTIVTRTMEFFRRWGFVERVRTSGFPDDYKLPILFCTSMTGHLLDRDDYPSTADSPVPDGTPHKRQRCPQMWLDPLLQDEARDRAGITLLFEHELTEFDQDAGGVTATLRRPSSEEVTVRADYMIGCDGAMSGVRETLGIEMQGHPKLNYSIGVLFRCPDLLPRTDMGEFERAILVGTEGTWGNLTVIDGSDLWRVTIFGNEKRFELGKFDAEHWVRRTLGRDDIPFEVLTIVPWRRTELVAERYGEGRVFLAGDAAHTMSPTGGMGVNTGFGDVVDLGWKLAATLQGWGGRDLLDSYGTERRPVARRNAAFSTHNFKTWRTTVPTEQIFREGPEGDVLRAEIGAALKASTKSDWQSWGIQLGYRYEDSPVVLHDGTPPTPDDFSVYVPTARPGHRAPHAWLRDGRSTLDLFGRAFVLLCFSADPAAVRHFAETARSLGLPLRAETIAEAKIAELYAAPLVLVRPDGHVAWRGRSGDEAATILTTAAGRRADAPTETA